MSVGPEAIPRSSDNHGNVRVFYQQELFIQSFHQIVFFGIMLGAPSWGLMADKCGRKKVSFHNIIIMILLMLLYMKMVRMYLTNTVLREAMTL